MLLSMSKTRVTLDLDMETDARLRMLAERRRQEKSGVVSDAIALLELFETEELSVEEDLRRLRAFEQSGEAIPLDDVKAWVRSWGTQNELPPPHPRKLA
jgi:predicted transcriptional regulator